MSLRARLRHRDRRGRASEALAAAWLRFHGFSILSRRTRIAGVEIDLVARRGPLVLVVEVKGRGRTPVPAESLVSPAQLARLDAAADALARRHDARVRLDLVVVRWTPWPRIAWHRGPWEA